MFFDSTNNYIHIELQKFLNNVEGIQAVDGFEKHAGDSGIVILNYSSDNESALTSAQFQ